MNPSALHGRRDQLELITPEHFPFNIRVHRAASAYILEAAAKARAQASSPESSPAPPVTHRPTGQQSLPPATPSQQEASNTPGVRSPHLLLGNRGWRKEPGEARINDSTEPQPRDRGGENAQGDSGSVQALDTATYHLTIDSHHNLFKFARAK